MIRGGHYSEAVSITDTYAGKGPEMIRVTRHDVDQITDRAQKRYRIPRQIMRWHIAISLGFIMTALSPYVLAAVPAFPGAEGFGAETAHGRGGVVVIVSNTNDSGPGSLREALMMEEPRIIIFRVSGTIVLKSAIILGAAQSNVAVFGQTAPGDGIALKNAGDRHMLQLSEVNPSHGQGFFHDGLFQHLRFRHGSAVLADSNDADNMILFGGTHNVVFDHNSFTWGGDEAFSVWGENIHDITFSHNLIAEGVVLCRETSALGAKSGDHGQNVGPLFGGGHPQYRITFHHNLMAHMCFRNILAFAGTDGVSDAGYQIINNVHYNNFTQEHGFSQNQYTGTSAIRADVIGDYFKSGPNAESWVWPFTVNRAGIGNDVGGPFEPVSLHLTGNTWRDINDRPHTGNNESNNYKMVNVQSDFGYGTGTWEVRDAPFAAQPTYPVTATSAVKAYADLVINRNVGATKPLLDSVDKRLVNDPEVGGAWSKDNIPSPRGSASYPVLTTFGVPTDTDSDGVPDNFEVESLGTNPNVFEQQGKLDHDGDGYSNIEEWVHSIPESSANFETRPNPPKLTATE
jgi:hypothetical protein